MESKDSETHSKLNGNTTKSSTRVTSIARTLCGDGCATVDSSAGGSVGARHSRTGFLLHITAIAMHKQLPKAVCLLGPHRAAVASAASSASSPGAATEHRGAAADAAAAEGSAAGTGCSAAGTAQ